ncbi:MAG: serine hydrolase domain-containing protein [Planctomycetota bacterium]|jgi:CubicO group peptidase (beta-lactamase class C family)
MRSRFSFLIPAARSLALVLTTASVAGEPLAGADSRAAPWPTQGWPVSTPAEHGLDADRLGELVELIEQGERFPDLHSLLVVRHGYLVLEEYFDGHEADDLHTLQSVSKSFTSAVIGIAIEQELIAGVEEPVLDFFPEHQGIENLDERRRAMTVEDLLTMRSGTDYHERGPDSPHFQLNRMARGWTEFILDRPMINDPGSRFQYDSGGVILMSALIKARTGEHADAFMTEHLFAPLGIKRQRWHRNAEGHPHMGGGLHLTSRDMAKFGLLYLRKGRWEDQQVVPAKWVEASFRRHVQFPEQMSPFAGYGYLWWVLPPADEDGEHPDILAACGFRAQYIFVAPEHEMVVVVTGGTRNHTDQGAPVRFLYSHILPAVED